MLCQAQGSELVDVNGDGLLDHGADHAFDSGSGSNVVQEVLLSNGCAWVSEEEFLGRRVLRSLGQINAVVE